MLMLFKKLSMSREGMQQDHNNLYLKGSQMSHALPYLKALAL